MGLSQTPLRTDERPAVLPQAYLAPPLPPSHVFLCDPDLSKLKARLQVMSKSDATAEVLRYQREVMEAQDSVRGQIASFSTILAGYGCSGIDPALSYVEGDSLIPRMDTEKKKEPKGDGNGSAGH